MSDDARIKPQRALISVSDKTGLVELGRGLARHGVELLSTGGSAAALAQAGIPVVEVSAHTGFPEMMDGRVKTLHPAIHGGILARRDAPEHVAAMGQHRIAPIDLIVVNLYPFEATVARGAPFEDCIENIDIGGPAMIRSAAKNHDFVAVVTDPADYAALLAELDAGGTTLALRRRLAAAAFARTGSYDAAIAGWFMAALGATAPRYLALGGTLAQTLRYGENPHQSAAFYVGGPRRPGVATATQLQGKELSYNNLNDTDAAYELVAEFAEPAVAIIKHASPCGVATAATLSDAYTRALKADPVSAFGGIVALNRPLDETTARQVAELFAEVVIAPAIDDAARAVLAAKRNLRVLATGALPDPTEPGLTVKSLAGGYLVQSRDVGRIGANALKTVTKRAPNAAELADLLLAVTIVKHVKSNAIVLVKDGMTVGIGGGQTSRVDAARQAVLKAAEFAAAAGEPASRAHGAVLASDAFFPFPDALQVALDAGVTAAIQPGGSLRGDDTAIAAADAAGAAMVLTGMRHFKH
jgi:phosphoribosylaminoimidazolecarboxamide formyltransferase / IMP cyclohydrolase